MSKIVLLASLICSTLAVPCMAQDYGEYPAPTPFYPFQRSYLTGHAICIPPYRRPFPIHVYTTPQQEPYYNVPPYAVAAPY